MVSDTLVHSFIHSFITIRRALYVENVESEAQEALAVARQ